MLCSAMRHAAPTQDIEKCCVVPWWKGHSCRPATGQSDFPTFHHADTAVVHRSFFRIFVASSAVGVEWIR